jgi:hypothetical protein
LPRNGSGSYSPPSNTWNPATADTPILSDDWNTTQADYATAITQSLASDGQTTASARIPFAQGISVSDGLLSAPAISPISDPDTGWYFPVANQVGLAVGGVAVMTATSSTVTFPVGVVFSGSPSITGNLTLTGNLTVDGNTTIGNASGDTLTVAATGTFTGNQTFSGSITVPDASFSNAKLATVATSTIKGRVTAGTGAVEDVTGAQVTTLLDPVVGATQSVAGTKGVVPAAAAGDQYKVLTGAGTFQVGYGRAFGCVITTTNVNGSQPTFTNGVNVASLSTLTVAGALSSCTATFTNALPNATYAVHGTTNGAPSGGTAGFTYGAKTTTTVVVYWENVVGNPTEISVSGFA